MQTNDKVKLFIRIVRIELNILNTLYPIKIDYQFFLYFRINQLISSKKIAIKALHLK